MAKTSENNEKKMQITFIVTTMLEAVFRVQGLYPNIENVLTL